VDLSILSTIVQSDLVDHLARNSGWRSSEIEQISFGRRRGGYQTGGWIHGSIQTKTVARGIGRLRRYTVLNMSIQKPMLVRLAGVSMGLAGLCMIWLHAQQPPKQPLNVQKVTDNLWVLMTNNSGNVAVLPTSDGVLLVDDKFDQDGPEILAKVKAISDKPIKYILNTHQHGDHTGGNAFMLMNTPAEILIHKNARANMVAGKQPGLPQVTYADEAQVFIGGKEVSAHHLGRGIPMAMR
jgi:hypothetical protein